MKKTLTVLMSVFFSLSVFAQQNPAPIKLTLQQSIDIAFKNNVSLQKQKNNVSLVGAEYLRSIGVFLPNLNASVSASYSESKSLADSSTTKNVIKEYTANNKSRNYSWEISSNLNLFNGFSDYLSLEQTMNNYEAAKLKLNRSAQETLLDVSSKFLDVLLKQELMGISKENLVYADEQLKKISEMTRLGSRPLIDLYNQQYQKANAELDLINAEKNLEISKSNLVAALALDPSQEYEIIKPDLSLFTGKSEIQSLSVLIPSALKSRPDYQASELSIKTKRSAVWQSYSNYIPSLTANWSYGKSGGTPDNKFSVADQFANNSSWRIGLTLSVPIFDRFQREYSVQQASVNLKNAELDLQSLERDITIGVKQAFLDYGSYKKRLEASETQFKAASTLKETAQERYNVGAGSYVELADAIRQYTSAASGLAQARYQYEFQKKVLEFYVGDLKVENYITID